MPQTRKIATCCYCGTRAVLVLNRARHVLACSACGAPLTEMKAMPARPAASVARSPILEQSPADRDEDTARKPLKRRKRRRRKPQIYRAFEEIWDEIEDIWD